MDDTLKIMRPFKNSMYEPPNLHSHYHGMYISISEYQSKYTITGVQ